MSADAIGHDFKFIFTIDLSLEQFLNSIEFCLFHEKLFANELMIFDLIRLAPWSWSRRFTICSWTEKILAIEHASHCN